MKNRLKNEINTVELMIRIYCKKKHKKNLCGKCNRLLTYSIERLEKCQFGDKKPVCSKCKVHCFKPEMREKIKEVMRFSGPKMIFRHPVYALQHLVKTVIPFRII